MHLSMLSRQVGAGLRVGIWSSFLAHR